MALRPEDRYPTCRALADDIERWAADEPVSAWREPFPLRARRWLRRRRILVAGVGSAVIVAAVSLAVSTGMLAAKNRDLERANQAEKAQRGRALANFRLARDSVDRYLTRVSDSKALRDAGQVALRKELMEEAGKFYERFINEGGSDLALETDLVRARVKVAKIEGDVGDKTRAIGQYATTQAILRGLLARKPGDAELTRELAASLVEVGRLNREIGRNDAAEIALRDAVATMEPLVDRGKPVDDNGKTLAYARAGARHALPRDRTLFRRQQALSESLTFYERAAAADPTDHRTINTLGSTHNNLGLIAHDLDRPADAIAHFQKSIEIGAPGRPPPRRIVVPRVRRERDPQPGPRPGGSAPARGGRGDPPRWHRRPQSPLP